MNNKTQPSQQVPRVDLTDEQIKDAILRLDDCEVIDGNGVTQEAISIVRALLTNTAQGKPEQDAAITLALQWDQSRKYIMPYIIRDALRAALAAKKG